MVYDSDDAGISAAHLALLSNLSLEFRHFNAQQERTKSSLSILRFTSLALSRRCLASIKIWLGYKDQAILKNLRRCNILVARLDDLSELNLSSIQA